MVGGNDLLVIDLLFSLKSSEQSFWGAPLIVSVRATPLELKRGDC